MKQYLDLMNRILVEGVDKGDRTGTGTRSLFGQQMRFNLQEGFPLLTTKKVHLKSIIHELLWFLQGSTNVRYLKENGVSIWDEWVKSETAEYRMLTQADRLRKLKSDELDAITHLQSSMVEAGSSEEDILEAVCAKLDELKVPTQELIAGELGPVYGKQWRSWPSPAKFIKGSDFATDNELEDEGEYVPGESIDQIANVVKRIKEKPNDRRLIVSAWNPAEVDEMALPPCHCLFQFYTRPLTLLQREQLCDLSKASGYEYLSEEDKHGHLDSIGVPQRYLDCQLYQRSCDFLLGVPFNIASYALLTMMLAQCCDMAPGEFVWTGGDVHLYNNHFEQAKTQLSRKPFILPKMVLNPKVKDIFAFKYDDFKLENYESHPSIAAPIAV